MTRNFYAKAVTRIPQQIVPNKRRALQEDARRKADENDS